MGRKAKREKPLRSEWHRSREGLFFFERYRLFKEALEITLLSPRSRSTRSISLHQIEATSLVKRMKHSKLRLQIDLVSGKKYILRVRDPVWWRKTIQRRTSKP